MSISTNKKLLPPYEQSLLLAAILFSRKHLDKILDFFPHEQAARLQNTSQKFLRLGQNERITQLILELRRLLLINQKTDKRPHKSWLDLALQNEPDYLKDIVKKLLDGESEGIAKIKNGPLILQCFLQGWLIKHDLYDPLLNTLVAIAHDKEHTSLYRLAKVGLSGLRENCNQARFDRYLLAKKINIDLSTDGSKWQTELFAYEVIRKLSLKFAVINSHNEKELLTNLGLFLLACYLFNLKTSQKNTIIYSFDVKRGQAIDNMSQVLEKSSLKDSINDEIKQFILHALALKL